jgi:hypothetical protein
MKRTKSEKFNCRANLANKHIQNRKSFNKKTPRIIAPVTNLNILNPMSKNFNVKSTSKIKFHHGTIITDYLLDEQKQKLFNISSMVKNSKSFDKDVASSKKHKQNDLNKYSSSVKKTAKVYKTLNNGVFEIDKGIGYKHHKAKIHKDASNLKLGASYTIPASSKRNHNLGQAPMKYFGSFKLTGSSDKDAKMMTKTAESHSKIKKKRLSKSSSKTQHSRSNTEYLQDINNEPLQKQPEISKAVVKGMFCSFQNLETFTFNVDNTLFIESQIFAKSKYAPKHRRNQTLFTSSNDNSLERHGDEMTQKVLETLFRHSEKGTRQPNQAKVQYIDDFNEDIESLAHKVGVESQKEIFRSQFQPQVHLITQSNLDEIAEEDTDDANPVKDIF